MALREALVTGVSPSALADYGWAGTGLAMPASGASSGVVRDMPTVAEAWALMVCASNTPSHEFAAVLALALLTGARRSELCGLQWGDIDWPGRRLTFRRFVGSSSSAGKLGDAHAHEARTIALDPVGMELLVARRSRAASEAQGECVALGEDAFVWSTRADGRIPRSPAGINSSFLRLCWRADAEAKVAGRAERWQLRFDDLCRLSGTGVTTICTGSGTVTSRLGPANPFRHALGLDRRI
jgi:integrase